MSLLSPTSGTTVSLLEESAMLFEPVPDFPVPGITFRDISPLLVSPRHFEACVRAMREQADAAPLSTADVILAVDARGFIFAAPLALASGRGLVMVRKSGKLPNSDVRGDQKTEYGSNILTFQSRFVRGRSFFVIDDVAATGGTVDSIVQMAESCGGHYLGTLCVLDLRYCRTGSRADVHSVFHMDSPAGKVVRTEAAPQI